MNYQNNDATAKGCVLENDSGHVGVHFGATTPSEIIIPVAEYLRILSERVTESDLTVTRRIETLIAEIGERLSLWLILKPWLILNARTDLQERARWVCDFPKGEELTIETVRFMLVCSQIREFHIYCGECKRYHDERETFVFKCGYGIYLYCINEYELLKEQWEMDL